MPETATPDLLAAIVAATRRIVELRAQVTPTGVLERLAEGQTIRAGAFRAAITASVPPRIIAECKRRSPSRGLLRGDYDPASIAVDYEKNGAAAISVLTEPTFFDGAPEHLQAVRNAVSLPILRKDFIVDRYQLLEARAWGASAVLLIAAVLTRSELVAFMTEAARLDLDALVEVHDADEVALAVDAGATIVGINNRNLKTLDVSTRTAGDLVHLLPQGVAGVAESGLRTPEDLARLTAAGCAAFLIGERFMMSPDPGAALREMRSCQHA